MASHKKWANFLSLTAQDGSRVSAPAELIFINCDVSRDGTLRARYRATVRCAQKRYIKVSLCCSDDENGIMSEADISIVGGEDDAEITATVLLSVNVTDGICLSAGNNPFIRRLLGCGDDSEFYMVWGDCDYPARPCVRTQELTSEKIAITAKEYGGGIKMTSVKPTYGREIILGCDGNSVMRAVRPYNVTARAVSAVVDARRAVLLGKDTESVFNVTVNGERMLKVDCDVVAGTIVTALKDKMFALGADGEIKSDPAGEYLAVITTGYADVYKVDSLDLTKILRVEKTNEQVEIMRGGSLALWGTSSLVIYDRDEDGVYSSFETVFPNATNRLVIREGDRYHCGYRRSTAFYRYAVTRTGSVKLEQVRVSSAQFFASYAGDAIAYGDKALYVKSIDVDYSADYDCVSLSESSASRTLKGVGENYVYAVENGFGKVYDLLHDTVTDIGSEYKANGKLLFGEGKAYVYDCYNGLRFAGGSYDIAGASDACIAGRGLFVLKNGNLYAYYIDGTGFAVRMPARSVGQNVTMSVRERNYNGIGAAASVTVMPV